MATPDRTWTDLDASGGRLEFETLLSDLSSRFVNLPTRDVDREIEGALRSVCELVGIDLAVLWQWSAGGTESFVVTHLYPPGLGRELGAAESRSRYPWVTAQVLAGRTTIVPSVAGLPPEAAQDREIALAAGIRSNLTIPLAVGGERPLGALALNTLREERGWPEALVSRLELVAQVFASALARRRADEALRESEEQARSTFEQAAVGIAHVGVDGRFLRVNDKLCAIVASPREELLRRTFQEITHPDDLDLDLGQVRRVLAGELATYSMEKRYLRGDGAWLWVNLTVSLVRDRKGDPRYFVAVVEDISGRKRAEEALRTSESRLEAGAELAGLGFYEVGFDGGVMYSDARLRELSGVPADRTSGLGVLEFWAEHLHPDDRPRVLAERERLHSGEVDRLSIEYRYEHPALGERWIHHLAGNAARPEGRRAVRTFGVLRDVTERVLSEAALRDLSRRLIRAQERERAFVARELHDDLSQRLALLAIEAGRAELAAEDSGPRQETLKSLREGIVRLSEDVHDLAYHLHPSILGELGLAEALRAECDRRARQVGFAVRVSIGEGSDIVESEPALCLFRVAQEALGNVARHAQARIVAVSLRRSHGGQLLEVRDDGRGFDPAVGGRPRTLGLASMRERVELVRGTLRIDSVPGEGTVVSAWVPGEVTGP